MNDDQITALAREYAKKYYSVDLMTVEAENVIRFLLRRYCLVEKSKIRDAYKDAQKDQYNSEGNFALTLAGRNRSAVLIDLFPKIAKEVKE